MVTSTTRRRRPAMLDLKLSAITGTTGVVAQTVLPAGHLEHIWERLGVAGILVAGAYFMLRYFMGVVTAKDTQISDLIEAQSEAAERNTTALILHIEKGYEVQRGTTIAIQELTSVVRELRDERRR